MKKLHQHFADNNFENVIIDPSTQRLSYVAFGNTKGLVEYTAHQNNQCWLTLKKNHVFLSLLMLIPMVSEPNGMQQYQWGER